MLFALAVTWVDFVDFFYPKSTEGRVTAMAAFMFFFKQRSIGLESQINISEKYMRTDCFCLTLQKRSWAEKNK
jgi:hypothetical protein